MVNPAALASSTLSKKITHALAHVGAWAHDQPINYDLCQELDRLIGINRVPSMKLKYRLLNSYTL